MNKPYYQDKWVTIYHGDCREILPELPKMDLVLTNPPYFLPAKHYETRGGSSKSWGDLSILDFYFAEIFKLMMSKMHSTAVAYIFCNGQSYPIFYKAGYSFFERMRPLIWDKISVWNGYSWRHQHEIIIFAEMPDSPKVNTADGDIIRERGVKFETRLHLAEKPVALLKILIAKSSSANHLILDPFMGSGTTCIAAKELNRHCIGIEIEEKYCEIAARRCSQEVMELNY